MIFKNFQPSLFLNGLVQVYHLRHFRFNPGMPVPFKAFPPRPEQYIAFYPRGFETTQLVRDGSTIIRPKSIISGQYTQLINRHVTHEFMIIQAAFAPGALHKLTGIPFSEMRDSSLDLESLFPKESREVNAKLEEAQEYSEMIRIVDEFLCGLFLRKAKINARPVDQVIGALATGEAYRKIDWLAGQACLSVRQFERLSYDYVGVSPKVFTRIARFNATYIMRLKNPQFTWLRIAIECGYQDYQHLVRDYKEFSNVTPNMLFNEEFRAPERILGLRPFKT
jgi:AraC-like DNA-binding protein